MDTSELILVFVSCVFAFGHATFLCPEENGLFRNRGDEKCISYWVCKDGKAELSKCPAKHMFHSVAKKCVEDEYLICMAVPVMPRKLSRVARDKGSSKGSDSEHHEEHKSSSSSDSSKKDIHKSSHSSSSEHKSHKKDKDHKDISNTSDHKKETKDSHIEYEKHYYHKEYFPVPIQVAAAAAAPVIPGVLGGGFPFAANQVQFAGQSPANGAGFRGYGPPARLQYPMNGPRFQGYQMPSQTYQQQMTYPQNSYQHAKPPPYYDYYTPSFDQYDDMSFNQPPVQRPSYESQQPYFASDNRRPQIQPAETTDQRFRHTSYESPDFRLPSREETMPLPPQIDPPMPQSPGTNESPLFQSRAQPTLFPSRIDDAPLSQPSQNDPPLFQPLPTEREQQQSREDKSPTPILPDMSGPVSRTAYPFGLSSSHENINGERDLLDNDRGRRNNIPTKTMPALHILGVL